MLAVEVTFPAGHYHATPWGHHVNEADVEWPPSPWRFYRALIAIWHRKSDHDEFPEEILEGLIASLAQSRPVYQVPEAVHTHTRHYMPGEKNKKSMVFDAFLCIDPSNRLVMAWPDLELPKAQKELFMHLLERIGYLGRAESWVEASLLQSWDERLANCKPGELSLDVHSGRRLEPVSLLCPMDAQSYKEWAKKTHEGLNLKGLNKKKRAEIVATLPDRLIDVLQLDTIDAQNCGWSRFPGTQEVLYQRPAGALAVRRHTPKIGGLERLPLTTARFALAGKPLPLLEDAIKVGERMRLALMGLAKIFYGPDDIPFEISGHHSGAGSAACHRHSFYLPEDADGDGRIDHILIHAPAGFSPQTLEVLDKIRTIKTREGQEWAAYLEGTGRVDDLRQTDCLCGSSRCWVSLTPYLHPWFVKKKFTVEDQVHRELRERGLEVPANIAFLDEIVIGRGQRRRSVHFHRFRSKRGLTQPDTRGRFLELTFDQPIDGPLALGFGCHFGLGLFLPK